MYNLIMVNYDIFAKFYDDALGDRIKSSTQVKELISAYNPTTKKLLELACGTGSVLKYLSKDFEVYGLDLSSEMLEIAKKKVPQAKLFSQDMVKFSISEQFDSIICVFDSINHILTFSNWEKIFVNAYSHLNDGGLFLFDLNTSKKLNRLVSEPPWTHCFHNNFMIMDITDAGKSVYNWNIKVFEHQTGQKYLLYEENIKEVSFPLQKVENSLKETYTSVEVVDTDQKEPSEDSERLFVICQK